MNKTILITILFAAFYLIGCKKEENLTPTERPEFGYAVPQGEHEYDAKIVDWNRKCNFFILYQFLPRDIYWSVNGWNEASEREDKASSPWVSGWKVTLADENYVGDQLRMLEQQFLCFYPDSILKRCMPLKLLLCDSLYYVGNMGNYARKNIYSGYDHLSIGWGNEAIRTITSKDIQTFKNDVNYEFLVRLKKNGKILDNPEFYNVSDYSVKLTSANMYENGFLAANVKIEEDWESFLKTVINTSYEVLTAEPTATDKTYKGILHAVKDKKGLIRKKYDSMVNYYKDRHGIDLQAIGNSVAK